MVKRALITGVAGQDGSYLSEFLLEKGYEVYGVVRPDKPVSPGRLDSIRDRLHLITADLADQRSLDEAVRQSAPDEVYNLAAETFVPNSWDDPAKSGEVTGIGVARLLGALRRYKPDARFCQASSAQIFGRPTETPQTEATPIRPVSPYGAAKSYAHFLTASYRASGSLFACSAILFNHESPRRSPEFVTRKITRAAAMIKLGLTREIRLGNLDSRRDWGFAGDYVRGMWLMLQQPSPGDFVLATGTARSVREWADIAFGVVGLRFENHMVTDTAFLRPAEVDVLVGSPEKAKRLLGWQPEVAFEDIIRQMVEEDLRLLSSRAAAGPR